jgi:hypothetical protein
MSRPKPNDWRAASTGLLALVLLAGCGREEVRVYRVPKEKPIQITASSAAPHAHPRGELPRLGWTLPAGWEERGPGRMSVASFHIHGSSGAEADVSVMPMPGESAGNLGMLVNIVRDSANMGPISDDELAKLVQNITVGEATAKLVDLSGATGSSGGDEKNRIVLAVLPREGMTWFFKLAGDAALVAAQKEAFLGFLKSISFHDAEASAVAVGEASPGPASTGAGAPPGQPQWEVPSGWQKVAATQRLLAKFQITAAAGKAEITVSSFPGDVGGVPANVNRWRGQLGLDPLPLDEAARLASPLDVLGGKAMLVDVRGDKAGQKLRLIGVIVPRDGQTWFYKLLGDDEVAEREKAAFLKFVQTVRYPNA